MDIEGHIATLESRIQRRLDVQSMRKQLQCLAYAMKCLEIIHQLDIQLADSTSAQERLPMLYRLSDVFLRIYEDEKLIAHTSWYSSVRERLTIADASFAKILGEDLLSGVQSGVAQRIQDYSIIYQHIGRLPTAYQVVAEGSVKPALTSVVLEMRSQDSELKDLLNSLFAAIEEKFYFLIYVDYADFAMQSVWTAVANLLTVEASAYFLPDSPDQFHQNYRASKQFMSSFVGLFSVVQKDFAERFWRHPGTISFLEKWSLPVYYQVRFLEIGAPVEKVLSNNITTTDGKSGFKLDATIVLWKSIQKCWNNEVCLPELLHRFWKLTLLLCARYQSWLEKSVAISDISSVTSDILSDLTILLERVPMLPDSVVAPYLVEFPVDRSAVLRSMQDSLGDTLTAFRNLERLFLDKLASSVVLDMMEILKSLQDIPRIYRKTNREAPSIYSPYVDAAFDLLGNKLIPSSGITPSQIEYCSRTVIANVAKQYGGMALDLLDAVKRMEESLKKLRKTRVIVDSTGVSDDDKIRLQLALDFLQMETRIQQLGLDVSLFEDFITTKQRVLEEKPPPAR
ncbi:conserved oligomeric Golgi complex subunit 2-like isoform X2 [Paramacrobiotus metropolitanus]|nr:conserved oligomeric Golgi complex subunit 2-like isoform X2 [Paramacrobiotus metropolitanus]